MSLPIARNLFAGLSLNRVFFVSLVLVAAFGAWGLIDPEGMSGTSLGFTNFMLTSVGWYWLLLCTGFLILSGYHAFGPYGHIKRVVRIQRAD